MSDNSTNIDTEQSSFDPKDVEISKTSEDKLYLYLTLIVQALGSITLIIIAVLRFIATRQNTKLNRIKNIYYTNKNKIISSEDTEPRDEEAKLEKCK